jgi:hypothetical protein
MGNTISHANVGQASMACREFDAGRSARALLVVNSSEESNDLKQAYLDAGVVGPASRNDAAHTAPATIFGADLVVSWNFKQIVNFERIAGYEGVNSLRGYRSPKIYSPREVVKN